ncbi:MAG: DMT family transporter [Alphaproteobacteria bacterium]|nr:DMT family transporter [Alphaproteobacteria bacterium]NNF25509.1 DMT family transporter [Paracoccaceae bacterium]
MLFRYWLIIIALGLGWGSSFYFNEVLLRELGPLSVSVGRVGIGAIGTWIYVLALRKTVNLSPRIVGQMAVMGVLSFGAPFALYPLSQTYIPSGAAGIINAMTPIMVVIVSHLWPGGERATWIKSLGVLCGFGGIVLLALPALQGGNGAALLGTLVALAAPVCYAVSLNYVRRLSGVDQTVMLAVALSFASFALAPIALATDGVPQITLAQTWAALLVLGLVLTSATFIIFYWLLPRVGATNISTVTFIAPVSAVLLGTFILNEALGLTHFLGMAAIFAGLLLIDGKLMGRLRRTAAKDQPSG